MCEYFFVLVPAFDEADVAAVRERLLALVGQRKFGITLEPDCRWDFGWPRIRAEMLRRSSLSEPVSVMGEIYDVPEGCCFANLVPNSATDFETVDYQSDPTIHFFRDLFKSFADRSLVFWYAGWGWEEAEDWSAEDSRQETAATFLARLSTFDANQTLGLGAFGHFHIPPSDAIGADPAVTEPR